MAGQCLGRHRQSEGDRLLGLKDETHSVHMEIFEDDMLDGVISVETALKDYGVVVSAKGRRRPRCNRESTRRGIG